MVTGHGASLAAGTPEVASSVGRMSGGGVGEASVRRWRRWRRWRGAIVLIVGVASLVTWVLVTEPIDVARSGSSGTVGAAAEQAAGSGAASPDGVVSWQSATAAGTRATIDWGSRCDTSTGTLAMPVDRPPPCYAPFSGDNGGATAPGVAADSIKVVVYRAPQSSSAQVDALVAGAASVSDADANVAAYTGYAEILSTYYETYGRRIDIEFFTGTGEGNDAVVAVADAETIARDLRPFIVLGGPALTNAFADTLAARKVVCFQCTPGQPSSWYAARDPYVWDLQKDPQQNGLMVNEYLGNRLIDRPAEFAGDPAMRGRQRVLGSIHIDLGPDTGGIVRVLQADAERRGIAYAAEGTYANPLELQNTARDIITRIKEAGVTTVVFTGDPLAPATLTKVATEQGWFPEWIVTGTALIDTAVLPRNYDQRQWAHAFGPANLFIGPADGSNAATQLWTWWFDADTPLPGTSGSLVLGALQIFLTGVQGTGPDLTPAHYRDAFFGGDPLPGSPTLGQISFGNKGLWSSPDYTAIDDQAEVWWDPTAVGEDEIGRVGAGLWQWVDGGARHLPGQWSRTTPRVFDPTQSSLVAPSPPAPRAYPPLR